MPHTPEFRDPDKAFGDAIKSGTLSVDPRAENFAGRFMYMHSDAEADYFKNIDTRRYLMALGKGRVQS